MSVDSGRARRSFDGACGVTRPGPYQIQPAINAVHSAAASAADADWWQILQLYDQLNAAERSYLRRSQQALM